MARSTLSERAEIIRIGRLRVSRSRSQNDSPSSPLEPGARATTTMRSAVWPSSTKLLTPSSRNLPSAAGAAVVSIPEASHRPLGSVKASVAVVSPRAIGGSRRCFSASVAAFMIAVAASTAVEK